MKFKLVLDSTLEEQVVVYAHSESELTDKIKRLVESEPWLIIGFKGESSIPLVLEDIHCFTVFEGHVFALTDNDRLQVRERIYVLEKILGNDFVKINQSCLANTKRIARFSASIGGSLQVTFKNGHKDYVSRRQLKSVKERMGL